MNKRILIAFCFLTVSLLLTEAFRLEKRSVDPKSLFRKAHARVDKEFVAKSLKIEDGLRLDLKSNAKTLENAIQEAHKQTEIQNNL